MRAPKLSLNRRELVVALAIVALSLALRVTWAVYADRPPQGLNDPLAYDLFAHRIADGDGYSRPTGGEEPTAYYPVGFPATLGGLYWLLDHTPIPAEYVLAGKLMNAVLSGLTTALVYLLARRLFDARIAAVGAFLHAAFPGQVFYTGTLLSEPLFTFLLMAALTVLLWERPRAEGTPWLRLTIAGLLLGAATLTRAITLLLPFVLFALWWWTYRRPRIAAAHAGVVLVGVLVFAVPWSVRNTVRMGTPVLISTNAGDDLCIGHHEGATGAFVITGPCFDGYDYENTSPARVEVDRNRDGLRKAISFALSHPVTEIGLSLRKAYWLLYTDADGLFAAESYGHDPFIPDNLQSALRYWADAWYFGATGWALLSAPLVILSRDGRRAAIVVVAAYVLAIPIVFFGDPRFHYPAVPLMTIVAGAGAVAVARAAVRGEPDIAPGWIRRGPVQTARQTADAPGTAGGGA